MEDEICQFNKYGFCRYKREFKRRHSSEECKDLDKCKSIKTCFKRHPKAYKKYKTGNCQSTSECAYHHEEPNEEEIKLVHKVNELEKVLQAQNEEKN